MVEGPLTASAVGGGLEGHLRMKPVRFGIVGSGWRSLFYLRIARELPDLFEVEGMVVRDAEKGAALEAKWGIKSYRTLDDMLRVSEPHFVVVSVPWSASPEVLSALAERSLPALAETPPAPDVAGLASLYTLQQHGLRMQVAEQYHLQPLQAAYIALARSGKLGTVTQAQISVAHGYHGVSLIRKLLGVSFEPVTITAHTFISPLVVGPDRNGLPTQEQIKSSKQVIAYLDFGEKLGVYDFSDDQYFSWVRSQRTLVRGERGEINNMQLRYLADFRTPITLTLERQDTGHYGNLEGYFHRGILAGSEWVYTNPFPSARLSDDEIAIASCLAKMQEYVENGTPFYSLAQAAQDHYINLLIEQAQQTGKPVTSTPQAWMQAQIDSH